MLSTVRVTINAITPTITASLVEDAVSFPVRSCVLPYIQAAAPAAIKKAIIKDDIIQTIINKACSIGTIKIMDFKKFLRWLGITLCGYALILALLFMANSIVFSLISSSPTRMKNIISDSGVYATIPNLISERSGASSEVNNALENPDVSRAIQEVFNSEFFQTSVESMLDSTYSWLNGQSATLSFSIDISKTKDDFISKAVDYRLATIETLPPCSLAQISGDIDVLTLQCKPPYPLDAAQLKEQVRSELAANNEILSKESFNSGEIKGQDGKPLSETMPNLPDNFQVAKNLPFVLGFCIILFSIGIIYISETKRKGLLVLSRFFIVAGIFTIFAPAAIRFMSDKLLNIASADQTTTQIVMPLLNEFNAQTRYIYIWTGVVTIILGIVGLLAYSGKVKLPKKLSK